MFSQATRLIGWLKISQIGMQMRSAHSRMSLADILSRPVAFDLFSLSQIKVKKLCLHWLEGAKKLVSAQGARTLS